MMLCALCVVIATCLLDVSAFRVQRLENTESCQRRIMHFKSYYVQSGEPTMMKCPSFQYLRLDLAMAFNLALNLTWYKNDSKKLVSEEESRIQAREDALWFFPASTEDTGHYHCILRNSSYCLEVTIYLRVVGSSKVSLPDIAYKQTAFRLTSGQVVCPDLSDFITKDADLKLKWYKDSIALPNVNGKFKYLEGTKYLHIEDVAAEDEGFYTCELTITHMGKQYPMTRIIQLQTVDQEKRIQPVIVYPNHKTIAAALGSRLIVPCKVFTGYGGNSMTVVWWLANDSYVDDLFQDGRITEAPFQETTENDGHYTEVQLVFDEVREEDFSTDFKCIARNNYGSHVLPAQIRQAGSPFSWYIAAVPAALACLIAGAICIYRYRKLRVQKHYALTAS